MPATEQTWRDIKLLHKLFAVSGVIMLVTTMWMFAKDHARPWKPYQRTANDVELTLTDWRKLQFETNEAVAEHTTLVSQLDSARRQAIDRALVDAFIQQVEASEVTAEHIDQAPSLLQAAEALLAVDGQPEAEAKRDVLIARMRAVVENLRVTEETRSGELKFARADRDAVVATLGLLVRDNRPAEEMAAQQIEVDGAIETVDRLQLVYDEARTQRTELLAIINKMTAAEDAAQEALSKNQAGLAQLETVEF